MLQSYYPCDTLPPHRAARPRSNARDLHWNTQRNVAIPALMDRAPPPTRETKSRFRASANSSPWQLKGVRYLFRYLFRIHAFVG